MSLPKYVNMLKTMENVNSLIYEIMAKHNIENNVIEDELEYMRLSEMAGEIESYSLTLRMMHNAVDEMSEYMSLYGYTSSFTTSKSSDISEQVGVDAKEYLHDQLSRLELEQVELLVDYSKSDIDETFDFNSKQMMELYKRSLEHFQHIVCIGANIHGLLADIFEMILGEISNNDEYTENIIRSF